MAQAYEVRKHLDSGGKEGIDPNGLSPRYRDKIVELAKGMKKSDLEHFAKTKRSGLPDKKVTENNSISTVDNVNGMGAPIFPTATAAGSGDLPRSSKRLRRFEEWKRRKRPKKS
jgi:hypothetical protein